MIMNPIPGVAGVDYPTFNSVPDTQFSCSAQEYPGIFADTFADCQVKDQGGWGGSLKDLGGVWQVK